MKEMLQKKKEELEKSITDLQQQAQKLQEQLTMYQGAWQYNNMLIQELEAVETAPVSE